MDDLINLLKNCVVESKKFDEGLDELISNLKIKEESDPNEEWDTLSENYSKLKHLHRLINFYKIKENGIDTLKFKKCLNLFLIEIDKTNQYYLRTLDWESEPFFLDKIKLIKNLLEESLNINDPYEKLEIIIKSYFMFLPIIEYFREDKFVENITDIQFLKDFKKRKFEK